MVRGYRYNVGISPLKGFLLPHNDEVKHLTYGRPSGLELNVNVQSDGSEAWHYRYNLPEYGISLTYFDTDMVETGELLSGMVYMKIPFFTGKTGSMMLQVGTGLTWASKVYDRETNNLNNVLSSRFTYNMQGRIGYQFNLGDRLLIYPAVTLTHASNGSLKLPNAGINIVSGNVGLAYKLVTMDPHSHPVDEPALERKWKWNLLFSGAAKEIYPAGGPKYGYWTVRSYFDRTLSRFSRFIVGGELVMNRALRADIARRVTDEDQPDYKRGSLLIGHELLVSRVSVMTQLGYYLYRPYDGDFDPDFYQRYGIKYYFSEKVFATGMLKVFIGRADTFDFGIGIRL